MLIDARRRELPKAMRHGCQFVERAISEGERFFLPADVQILKEKKYTDDVKDLLRLPYDQIAVLSNGRMPTGEIKTMEIVVACSPDESILDALNDPRIPAGSSVLFATYTTLKSDLGWRILPAGAVVISAPNTVGLHIKPVPLIEGLSMEEMSGIAAGSILSVTNLCTMLGLNNVKTIVESAGSKLNVKRERSGKLPLYSYKVLNVDGELWGTSSQHGDGAGFRSHMRRGHIRRLDENRRVWVRATLVHGKIPGFVDKEYHTSSDSL